MHRRSPVADAALEARFGLRLAHRLTQQADDLPHDIAERLRSAREQALARAKPRLIGARAGVPAGGALALAGDDGDSGWWRWSSLVPLVLLILGLVALQQWHHLEEISAAAEVDAALLTDEVPPSAYADPGFMEFLRAPGSVQPD